MNYVFIEVFYFIVWPLAFISTLRRRSVAAREELIILLFSLPLVVIMELRNEFLQPNTGVYYPASLFYFPGFNFPVALVLASSLFPWLLYIFSLALADRLAGSHMPAASWLQVGFFLVLNSLFYLPEYFGPIVGWWQWRIPWPETFQVLAGKYIFYLWFSFPPFLVAKLASWQAARGGTGRAVLTEHQASG